MYQCCVLNACLLRHAYLVMITAGPSTPAPHSILLALVAPVIPLTALKVGDRGGTADLVGLEDVRLG